MPDQNNPIDPSVSPTPVNPPSEPTQPIPVSNVPPPMDIPAGDASLPPPFPPETPPIESAMPPSDSGSAAPGFDIPPVIAPVGKPRGGDKRVIATILGLLVLVGGIGAGIILVRQQQDIREKAATLCQEEVGGSCVPTNYTCTTNYSIFNNSCGAGKKCGVNCQAPVSAPSGEVCESKGGVCRSPNSSDVTNAKQKLGAQDCPADEVCVVLGTAPAPQPAPGGNGETQACTRITSTPRRASGTSLTVTDSDLENCKRGTACRDGQLWATKYTCDGINLSQGCNDNGIILDDNVTAQEIVDGKTFQVGSLNCGTVQIDVGCKDAAGTYGNVAFLVESAATACTTTSTGGGPTAQCLNIKAFDTEWNELTSAQLSELKVGDTVRFTVAGQASSGSFDKARFKVNGVQKPEVTGKRPGTEEYYDEYTIPEGITTFTINAQIHHTVLGWSN